MFLAVSRKKHVITQSHSFNCVPYISKKSPAHMEKLLFPAISSAGTVSGIKTFLNWSSSWITLELWEIKGWMAYWCFFEVLFNTKLNHSLLCLFWMCQALLAYSEHLNDVAISCKQGPSETSSETGDRTLKIGGHAGEEASCVAIKKAQLLLLGARWGLTTESI